MTLEQRVKAYRRRCIQSALHASGGNVTKAAKILGLRRQNLYRACERVGVPLRDNSVSGLLSNWQRADGLGPT